MDQTNKKIEIFSKMVSVNLGGNIPIFLESLFLISYLMLEKQGEMSRMAAETGS